MSRLGAGGRCPADCYEAGRAEEGTENCRLRRERSSCSALDTLCPAYSLNGVEPAGQPEKIFVRARTLGLLTGITLGATFQSVSLLSETHLCAPVPERAPTGTQRGPQGLTLGCPCNCSGERMRKERPETAAATGRAPGKAAHVVTTREASRPAGARRSCLNQVSSVHGVSAERQGGLEPQVALAFCVRHARGKADALACRCGKPPAEVNRVER